MMQSAAPSLQASLAGTKCSLSMLIQNAVTSALQAFTDEGTGNVLMVTKCVTKWHQRMRATRRIGKKHPSDHCAVHV
jgi:hypothetical protein